MYVHSPLLLLPVTISTFSAGSTSGPIMSWLLANFGPGQPLYLLFFVGMAILSGRMALDEFEWGDTSPSIGVPTWWYSMWLPILSTTLSLRLLGMWVRRWQAKS